ncbi:MAG: hypothetical protein WCD86_03645 [Ktedonobacteraceae bacterium]
MRTQSPDTSPEVERVQIALFPQAPISKRFAIMSAWSQLLIGANKESIRRQYPNADEKEIGLIFVARHYGQDIADKLQTISVREKATQSFDSPLLSDAIMLVIEALERLDVSHYLGGSVASSIYGITRADFLKARAFDQEAFRRPQRRQILGDTRFFNITSPEDIILNKLEWYRMGGEVSDRQWGDVLGVLKVQGTNLDLAYLRRWAVALNVADLLERALDDAGLAA